MRGETVWTGEVHPVTILWHTQSVKRLEHIAVVLTFAPVIYAIERVLVNLNGEAHPPNEPFRRFIWDCMWIDLKDG